MPLWQWTQGKELLLGPEALVKHASSRKFSRENSPAYTYLQYKYLWIDT